MFCKHDLLLVIPKLEICDIVLRLWWRVVRASLFLLFLLLFALFLQLFRCLFGLPCKVLRTDLPAQNASLRPVTAVYAELDLLKNEFGLFTP